MNAVTFGKAIADETRQVIMQMLCCNWLCVSDIVDRLSITQPSVSHHLSILREAGLVETRREGKQVFYTLNMDAVTQCCGLIMQKFVPDKELVIVSND